MSKILVNNLFNGSYTKYNLGHEWINIFKSDDGKCYVYINSHGKILEKKQNNIDYILFITKSNQKCARVVSAIDMKDAEYCEYKREDIRYNNIKYDDIFLDEYFDNNNNNSIFLT